LADDTVNKIENILKQYTAMTVSELIEKLSLSRYQQAKLLPSVWKMVFEGICHADFKNSELTMNSQIGLGIYE